MIQPVRYTNIYCPSEQCKRSTRHVATAVPGEWLCVRCNVVRPNRTAVQQK